MPPRFETTRFEILREIGKGGMGVVYAALDRERNFEVALKVIREAGTDSLHFFKQEFRSIADIVHPNLICLHELFAEGDQWFFTMELIEGVQFLPFVRGEVARHADTPNSADLLTIAEMSVSAMETAEFTDVTAAHRGVRGARLPAGMRVTAANGIESQRLVPRKQLDCDVERLRDVLSQMAQGLVAVHSHGKLHRDIKSSNVMVTTQGRAVILDFGLASTMEDLNRMRARGLVGTLAYASPEQTTGEPLTPASDWYSVGVMIYEALTGYSPFGGDTESLLENKLTAPPAAPEELVDGVPEDLSDLCQELMRIDPQTRPTGQEVLARLHVESAPTYYAGTAPSAVDFIGRERELATLEEALAAARTGSPAVALVHGPSGFGKSSLVQKFLSGLSSPDTLVLRGRCYEQESVPYKGIDSAVDTLAQELDHWPEIVELVRVTGLKALVQVFPVLLQAESVRKRYQDGQDIVDPQMRRRAAFQCLRDIFSRIQRQRQLVLCIDDMQWSDAESVQLLGSLVAAPDAPPVLYLASYRSEYEGRNPWLQQWVDVVKSSGAKYFPVAVGAFSPAESRQLAVRILGSASDAKGVSAARIVGEGEGNPFFINQLAESAREQGSRTEAVAEKITLDTVLRHRVSTLPANARDLLEIISVAGRPIAKSDAYAAAGFEHQDPAVLNVLRIANLTRSFTFGDVETVETYHDRIRESVANSLPRERARSRHRTLAVRLEATGKTDPETLAVHFEGAEDRGKAAHYYESAGNRAATALAFDKAARFFQRSMSLGDFSEAVLRQTRLKLAEALANAGRGRAAAEEYDLLAQQAGPAESLELERRAGFLYCSTGHLDKGLRVYERIVSRLGFREPRSRQMLILFIVYRLLRLLMRGLEYKPRSAEQVPPELLTRIDTTWSLAAGLALIDITRSMNLSLIALGDALRAGEPERLLKVVLITCWIPLMTRIGGRSFSDRILAIGEELVPLIETPKARAYLEHARGAIAHGTSEWNGALLHLESAERIYRENCTGVSWELAVANTVVLYAHFTAGNYAEMLHRAEATISDAIETGNLYSYTIAETFPAAVGQLAMDNPVEARRYHRSGLARWSTQGYDVQNAMAATAIGFIEFYDRRGADLLPFMQKEWEIMSQYGFAQHPAIRSPFLNFWVRAALAKAVLPETAQAERKKLLRLAGQKTRMLGKSPGKFAEALYPCTLAELAEARGDKQTALEELSKSEKLYRNLEMKGYAAAVQRRRGVLAAGEQGSAMVREADEKLRACGVINPERMAATLVGGWQLNS